MYRALWVVPSALAMMCALGASVPTPVPTWLFPPESSAVARPPVPHTLPGSDLRATAAQLGDLQGAVD